MYGYILIRSHLYEHTLYSSFRYEEYFLILLYISGKISHPVEGQIY